MKEGNDKSKWLKKTLTEYEKKIQYIQEIMKKSQYRRNSHKRDKISLVHRKLLSGMLRTKLSFCDEGDILVEKKYRDILKLLDDDEFNLSLAADSAYLYNLAALYIYIPVIDDVMNFKDAKEKSIYFLICSLARSPKLWNVANKDIYFKDIENLEYLKNKLESVRSKTSQLEKLEGHLFKEKIDEVLEP